MSEACHSSSYMQDLCMIFSQIYINYIMFFWWTVVYFGKFPSNQLTQFPPLVIFTLPKVSVSLAKYNQHNRA